MQRDNSHKTDYIFSSQERLGFQSVLFPSGYINSLFIFVFFFAIYLTFGLFATVNIPSQIPLIPVVDVFFGSDSMRVFNDMTQVMTDNAHYRISVHPLFLLLLQPLTLMLNGFVNNQALSTVIIGSAAGAAMVILFSTILRNLSIRPPIQTLFTVILGISFPMILFSGVPETFVFGGLGLIGTWWLAIKLSQDESPLSKKEVLLLAFFGVICFGMTITNFLSYCICLLFLLYQKRGKKDVIRIAVSFLIVLFAIVALCVFQKYVWPDTHPFWSSILSAASGKEIYEETRYMNFMFTSEKTEIWFEQALFYPLLPGQIVLSENNRLAWDGYSPLQICAYIIFLSIILFFIFKILFMNKGEKKIKSLVIFLLIDWLSHIALHYFYGYNQAFMFSPHFSYLLLLVGAICIDKSVTEESGDQVTKNDPTVKVLMAILIIFILIEGASSLFASISAIDIVFTLANNTQSLKITLYLLIISTIEMTICALIIRNVFTRISKEQGQIAAYFYCACGYCIIIFFISAFLIAIY